MYPQWRSVQKRFLAAILILTVVLIVRYARHGGDLRKGSTVYKLRPIVLSPKSELEPVLRKRLSLVPSPPALATPSAKPEAFTTTTPKADTENGFQELRLPALENPADRSTYFSKENSFQKNLTCKIPFVYPYEPYALKLIRQDIDGIPMPRCLANPPTTKFRTDEDTRLIMIQDTGTERSFWKNNACCYIPFEGMDKRYRNLSACINIVDPTTTIPSIWTNIQVLCYNISKSLTYRDYFHFFRLNPTKEKALNKKLSPTNYLPSILILGLDTVSHVNFQRFFPTTRKFLLDELDSVEFSGLNKLGFGTMENLVPMVSNCRWDPRGRTIYPSDDQDCTQIWERFSNVGYRTVHTVEEAWVLLYQRMRRRLRGVHNMTYSNLDFAQGVQRTAPSALEEYGCFEHKFAFDIVADRVLQVGRKLKKPYFHFTWSVLETHQVIAMSQILDAPFLKLLKTLKRERLLTNTILILVSDHGMVSNGEYAHTMEGEIEANAPLLYVSLPAPFKKKYTAAIRNLKRNADTLVTPYDICRTFESILDLTTITNRVLQEDPDPNPDKGNPNPKGETNPGTKSRVKRNFDMKSPSPHPTSDENSIIDLQDNSDNPDPKGDSNDPDPKEDSNNPDPKSDSNNLDPNNDSYHPDPNNDSYHPDPKGDSNQPVPKVESRDPKDESDHPKANPEGISLFHPIPFNRTCKDAFIPDHYCLCWSWDDFPNATTNPYVQAAAAHTVSHINQHLKSYPNCLPLSLHEIESAKRTSDSFGTTYLSVAFTTTPSNAKFEAMLSFRLETDGSKPNFELVGNVERKNLYGKQSACLGKQMQLVGWIRSVCFCEDFKF